eukprot:2838899-Heterocapsa_arctica.AAC.1
MIALRVRLTGKVFWCCQRCRGELPYVPGILPTWYVAPGFDPWYMGWGARGFTQPIYIHDSRAPGRKENATQNDEDTETGQLDVQESCRRSPHILLHHQHPAVQNCNG